jgi:hypothetical protein
MGYYNLNKHFNWMGHGRNPYDILGSQSDTTDYPVHGLGVLPRTDATQSVYSVIH